MVKKIFSHPLTVRRLAAHTLTMVYTMVCSQRSFTAGGRRRDARAFKNPPAACSKLKVERACARNASPPQAASSGMGRVATPPRAMQECHTGPCHAGGIWPTYAPVPVSVREGGCALLPGLGRASCRARLRRCADGRLASQAGGTGPSAPHGEARTELRGLEVRVTSAPGRPPTRTCSGLGLPEEMPVASTAAESTWHGAALTSGPVRSTGVVNPAASPVAEPVAGRCGRPVCAGSGYAAISLSLPPCKAPGYASPP